MIHGERERKWNGLQDKVNGSSPLYLQKADSGECLHSITAHASAEGKVRRPDQRSWQADSKSRRWRHGNIPFAMSAHRE
jgi:hypothetical protein